MEELDGPVYQRRCSYCGNEVEENQGCCGEVHNELMPECPKCGWEIHWTHHDTPHGECSVPRCTNCEWEGDPQ